MTKLLLSASFLSLTLLVAFGTNNPSNPIMWLASTSHDFTILRVALMGSLLVLLTAGSFMNVSLRTVIGLAAVGLVGYTLRATYVNDIGFEDTLALLMTGISVCIAALEPRPEVSNTYARPVRVPKAASTKARLATSH
jgi:hypothetical protein